ncbi:hypothetical protein QJR73_10155 [Lachnoanaerobaculum gingivalis]|nr:hypothetical protein [Lachnoanaerobaculum gingivalis]WHE86642.1 hypothetical protein QJR73_10155 [Lachnoanaerobaculum gingivalis]
MTARPIRRNAQTPDRNGKIFYTSTTSLSHISKITGYKAAYGWRRYCPYRLKAYSATCKSFEVRRNLCLVFSIR